MLLAGVNPRDLSFALFISLVASLIIDAILHLALIPYVPYLTYPVAFFAALGFYVHRNGSTLAETTYVSVLLGALFAVIESAFNVSVVVLSFRLFPPAGMDASQFVVPGTSIPALLTYAAMYSVFALFSGILAFLLSRLLTLSFGRAEVQSRLSHG